MPIDWSERCGFRPPALIFYLSLRQPKPTVSFWATQLWIGLPGLTPGHYHLYQKSDLSHSPALSLSPMLLHGPLFFRFQRYAIRLLYEEAPGPLSAIEIGGFTRTRIERRVLEIQTRQGASRLVRARFAGLTGLDTLWWVYEIRTDHVLRNERACHVHYLLT